jgi:hypothetical protein
MNGAPTSLLLIGASAAKRRCRQLIDGDVDAVDWVELSGQR